MKHHIDTSWNETWTDTDQVRGVKFEGNRLILSTIPAPSAVDGKLVTAVLTWERVQ
jgi:Lipocalin-like domain